MKRLTDIVFALLLWMTAFAFFIGFVAGLSFEQWILFDIMAVIVCGLIGFVKKIKLLKIIAGVIIAAFVLRFTLPLWLIIDLAIICSCSYVGYLLVKRDVVRLQQL